MPMTRTLISLERELHERGRRRAEELGLSFAEYVRQLLAQDLGEPRRTVDPSILFNLGESTGSDVARDKHRMIGEAIEALHEEKRSRRRGARARTRR
jgi:hypothetical protein